MAYLPTSKDVDGMLNGEDGPLTLTGSMAAGAPASSGDTTAPAGGLSTTAPSAPRRPLGTGTTLSGLGERAERISSDLGGLVSRFREEAGPSRSFGAEQEETLRGAIGGGGDFDDALGLTMARYGGPAGLDEGDLAGFEYDLGQVGAITDPLARGRGLVEFEQQRTPGLTPGEARFEAERRFEDVIPEAITLGRRARMGLGDVMREREEAAAFAAERGEEERGIREAAREFVAGEEARRIGELEERAAAENQRAQDIAAAWRALQETQDIGSIYDVADPETQAELDRFIVGARERENEAQQVWDSIMGDPRFDAIKDIPVGRLKISPDGKERVYVEVDGKEYPLLSIMWAREIPPGWTAQDAYRLGALLEERQAEMELQFSPVTSRTQNLENFVLSETRELGSSLDLERLAEQGYRGTFADVMPLYSEDLLMSPRPGAAPLERFVEYTEAPEATISTAATEAEAAELNRVYDLLGRGQDFTRRERAAPGLSVTAEGREAYNQQEVERYLGMLDALRDAEISQREAQQGQRAAYEASRSDWWDDIIAPLAHLNPFTAAWYHGAHAIHDVLEPGGIPNQEIPPTLAEALRLYGPEVSGPTTLQA